MTYYPLPGKENLDATLESSKKAAEELGLDDAIVASTTGFTAKRALEVFKGTGINSHL